MIYSKYPLKVLQEVAPFPPIQNTDNPYATEAAMHADQSNQLEGYGYLVDGVGAFTYLGTVAGTAADYEGFGGGVVSGTANITPNDYTGTDTEKIQAALNYTAANKLTLYIPKKDGINTPWNIESAILLKSNTTIIVDGAILKLTDTSRDNIFRTENCGFGIVSPFTVLENIHIKGINGATLEGADDPRSTGGNKILVSDSTNVWNKSYGSDANVPGESQYGDWRNYGILLAYTDNFSINGFTLEKLHSWGIEMEKCKKGSVKNIVGSLYEARTINGSTKYIRNLAIVQFINGCSDITIDNISGHSADDNIAATILNTGESEGVYDTLQVTGDTITGSLSDCFNIIIKNVVCSTQHNTIRIWNIQNTKIYNVTIENITDTTSLPYTTNSVLNLGYVGGDYGAVGSLGEVYDFNINNIYNNNKSYCISITGSGLADSNISNITDFSNINTNHPIYFDTSGGGARDILTSNIFKKNYNLDLSAFIDGVTFKRSGLKINKTSKKLHLFDELRAIDGEVVTKDTASPTDVKYFWSGTQIQYNALTKDVNTVYIIVG